MLVQIPLGSVQFMPVILAAPASGQVPLMVPMAAPTNVRAFSRPTGRMQCCDYCEHYPWGSTCYGCEECPV